MFTSGDYELTFKLGGEALRHHYGQRARHVAVRVSPPDDFKGVICHVSDRKLE